jgi:tRNA pseudouridine55 synthase
MDGLLIIDKPTGCTSHDVVLRVRRVLGQKRAGHAGTLDPEATGVLLVALGQATRFFPYLSGHDKTYEGRIRLGFSTDTYDASGEMASAETEAAALPGREAVAGAMKTLEGDGLQVPPPYSAKKVGGKPAYKLARAGRDVVLEPVRIRVRSFRLTDYSPPLLGFEVECSAGTYVRSLAHDLGLRLGCGAHLRSLRRTASGPYSVRAAVSLAGLEEAAEAGRADGLVVPVERLLTDLPAVSLVPEAVGRVLNGSPLRPEDLAGPGAEELARGGSAVCRVFDPSGKLLALARPSPPRDSLRPFLVLR